MAGQTSAWNDDNRALWLKIANNLYTYAVDFGATGLTPPSWNDSINDLQRKAAYISAKAVDIHP